MANSVLIAVSSSLTMVWMRARERRTVEIFGDLAGELVELGLDLVAAERGQPLQPQIEDGLGLLRRQLRGARGRHRMARIVDQRDHGGDVARRPVALHHFLARLVGVLGGADEFYHVVDISDRNGQPDQDVGAVARLAEQMLGAPINDLLAELDERGEQILQVHHQRAAAVERHHIGAERALQRGEAVKLVEHHVGHRVAPHFDHHAVAVAVGFVAQRRNALELLVAHQFADALDQVRLVDLIGNFGNHDRLALAAQRLELDLAANDDRAAAEMIGGADALAAENDAAGRKIRPRHDGDQIVDRQARIVDQRDTGIDHLAEIVRRDIGRHADSDAARAVDQQVRELGRQHDRFLLAAVIVRLEVDGVLVEVIEQRDCGPGQPNLGVALGRRRVAVDRAEIALAVDQRQPHGEVLRQPHQGVVDRQIAMGVIFAHGIAGDARRFVVGPLRRVIVLVHRIEDAPMHRLEPVAHVRQRARHDHAHGVIEIALLHLLRDRHGANIGRSAVAGRGAFLVGH